MNVIAWNGDEFSRGQEASIWRWGPALVLILVVCVIVIRWWISFLTGWAALGIVLGLAGLLDLAVLQRAWNEDQAGRIVEFIVLEPIDNTVTPSPADLPTPLDALGREPGAVSVYVVCAGGLARSLGASARGSWSVGEVADLADDDVWRVSSIVVLAAPRGESLQARLDARCK